MNKVIRSLIVILLVSPSLAALAQPGRGRGHGRDPRHAADRDVFHFLLTNHEKITRSVTELPNGVETVTESNDPGIAAKIKEHVRWMEDRIERGNPIRMRDPLFAEIFRHADHIHMTHEETERGVRVKETSDDAYVTKLIQAHAKAVSGFVARGFNAAMKNHSLPGRDVVPARTPKNPVIGPYGRVFRLPEASHQPRDGSRIVVDVTGGGPHDQLLPSIEKLARYVNIFAGAGKEKADVHIAVVLHGDATLAALHTEAYAARFETDANPNAECLHKLHEAGAEIFVCGQSLLHQGEDPKNTLVFCDVAVSALTAIANLQADDHAYIPLR